MSLNRHRNVMWREIRMAVRVFATAFAALAVSVAASICVASAEELTQAEIRDELVGRQIVWWQSDGWQSGHLTLGPNGAAELSVDRPGHQVDTGRWTVRGEELCTEWTTLRSGTEKCYRIERSAGGRFLTSGGNVFEIREAGV
jgi:hypothetical protein